VARNRPIIAFPQKPCVELDRYYRLYSDLGIGTKRMIGARRAKGEEFALGGQAVVDNLSMAQPRPTPIGAEMAPTPGPAQQKTSGRPPHLVHRLQRASQQLA